MAFRFALSGACRQRFHAPTFSRSICQKQFPRLIPDKIIDLRNKFFSRVPQIPPQKTPLEQVYDLGKLRKVDDVWKRIIQDNQGELFQAFGLDEMQQADFFQAIRQAETPIKSLLMPMPIDKRFIGKVLQLTANNYQGALAVLNLVFRGYSDFQRIEYYNLEGRKVEALDLTHFRNDLVSQVDAIFLHNIRLTMDNIIILSEFLENNQNNICALAIFSPESKYFAEI